MKWLVTFKQHVDRESVLDKLRSLGCDLRDEGRVQPLGTDEVVLSVEGPPNLAKLAEPLKGTVKVYPDSKKSKY